MNLRRHLDIINESRHINEILGSVRQTFVGREADLDKTSEWLNGYIPKMRGETGEGIVEYERGFFNLHNGPSWVRTDHAPIIGLEATVEHQSTFSYAIILREGSKSAPGHALFRRTLAPFMINYVEDAKNPLLYIGAGEMRENIWGTGEKVFVLKNERIYVTESMLAHYRKMPAIDALMEAMPGTMLSAGNIGLAASRIF